MSKIDKDEEKNNLNQVAQFKYDKSFSDFLEYEPALFLCLKVYLNINSIVIKEEKLIPLICQVKDNIKRE